MNPICSLSLTVAFVLVGATGVICRTSAPANATVLPTIRVGKPPAVQHGPLPNAIYGTIVHIAGNLLTLQTRTGRLRQVDATPAIAAGTYSGPLFVGKLVVAEGVLRTNGTLSAARVSRLSRLEGSNPDR